MGMIQQADGNGGRKGEAKGEGPLVLWFWSPSKTRTGRAGCGMTGVCCHLEGRIWQPGEDEWTCGRGLFGPGSSQTILTHVCCPQVGKETAGKQVWMFGKS